ncbi:putative sterigmatocystin biosynthesis peroxidase stcC [Phytophthora citrophthora]|uniref:Sterigmatocystin biosynthesis peroxidase stcC n=1 Tax=Phytophthora citrophthora TaxID=4793 RepID=A0AAD9LM27_9STRA|nr:putative sterigmatocystin biosynthesis peroxidase stcC [Phytophthora citrophthora]
MATIWLLFLVMFSRACCRPALNLRSAAASTVVNTDHQYVRPSGSDVSGFPPPNSALNHRSPCPALNSLANHGFLPRNGKSLTPEMIRNAIMEVFNIDETLAERLTRPLPSQLTLADLSVHGFIEHDASLVHDDTYLKKDPAEINITLADNLFAKSKDGKLDKHVLATGRRQRESQCKKENPEYALPVKAQAAAYGESALLLLAMGDYESETISEEHAKSFLVDEKIPDDFHRSDKPISTATAFYLAAQIKLLASLGWGSPVELE